MIRDTVIFVTLGLAIATSWHYLWVKPHQEFLFAVMDCMDENKFDDQEGYNICAEKISNIP